MKKRMAALFLCVSVCAAMAAGCSGSIDTDVSTISLQKNGKIKEVSIEDFSMSYYDEEELEEYINDAVDEYTEENGKNTVKVSAFSVDEDTACLSVLYESADIYADFSGEECFAGDIVEAQTAGYDFDLDFYAAEDGVLGSEIVSTDDIIENDDLNVFIIRADSNIQVPGEIVYVSADSTQLAASDTVSVDSEDDDSSEMTLVYIIYE